LQKGLFNVEKRHPPVHDQPLSAAVECRQNSRRLCRP
jgi:hypothetical protein